MALRKVALDKPVVIADITEKDLQEIRICEVDGVATVLVTYMEPDSRGLLRPQTVSRPLFDTMTEPKFEAWLDKIVA